MNGDRNKPTLLIILCVVFLFTESGACLITGEHGNRLIEDHGWPAGSVAVANLSSRLGYWEGPPFGGGEYQFLYRCQNMDDFNKALKIFAAIRAPKLELVVHNGPEYNFWLKKDEGELSKLENRVDWTFTVWIPESWNRLFNNPKSLFESDHPNFRKHVAAPRIDVYIGGGSIVWEDVKVPGNLVVIDKRPGSLSPEFADGGLVRGKVFDMATGQPIAGAEIVLATYQNQREWKEVMRGTTDQKGLCQIAKIPLGYYEVRVIAEGYVSRKQGNYDNKRPEYLQFEVGLTRPSYVKGIVTDPNGNPIESVKVLAVNVIGKDRFGYWCVGDKFSITDKEGRFEIRPLPEGLMNVMCDAKGLHLKNSIFEEYPIPSDKLKLIMEGTGTVHGKVVTEKGSVPVGQIVLEIGPPGEEKIGKWSYSGYLSKDGTFNISGIPPGEYIITTRLNPSSPSYKPNEQRIIVEPGKTIEIEIRHIE